MYSNKTVKHSIKTVSSSIVLTHLILLGVLKLKVNHLKRLESQVQEKFQHVKILTVVKNQPTECVFVTPPCEYIIVWENFTLKFFVGGVA